MSYFERQVYDQRALAEQQSAALAETARKQQQTQREFANFLLSRGVHPSPYFEVSQTSREREGLGKYLGGRTSYVITREYTMVGRCWIFAFSDFSKHYAITTDARLIRVTVHKPEPSKHSKLKLDAEAEDLFQAGGSLLVFSSEETWAYIDLVRAAQSLVDGNGPISAADSN